MKRTLILAIAAIFFGLGFNAQAQTITNASYSTIAHVKSDGTIQDSGYHTLGHARGVPAKWAAFLFFFL